MRKDHDLKEIERALAKADSESQRRFLSDLPRLLKLSGADLAMLKAAESAFDFWNNPDDIIYDRL